MKPITVIEVEKTARKRFDKTGRCRQKWMLGDRRIEKESYYGMCQYRCRRFFKNHANFLREIVKCCGLKFESA